ncbi:exodeoxyribonuclease VII small subunit [Grimontia hollisae]|uniref:Exodeoxyribonuclease 7 small subunit n=2 Tax=Grimontia hollisae TaxID=673 RepID=D0I7M7_GRIHO|nr:exodeoxyribonuclease VII small subunit [Grimontia hollisae]AMG31215.1 exodeoxyribonuclease VII small subunit [Grimontia hollisae]EEY72646.1 exodeoxyribonuclease VII small subunit [Grimontia hollisae CIP 101886]MDF2185362.1 exodeoxyribonuclease VII small subunit [Grimontia hollisae]STO46232.1 Exodeoxyribonuclease 7 small subunit [Grimontia hollisae]STO58232.1 Exodeoxyribonuclease 7 small subunit [Grimontia hollisae]
MAAKKPENMNFEETLKELDTIVNGLESGELPLDTALKQFERGISLARQGQKTLSDAEQRVEILLAQDDNAPLEPFEDTRDE